MDKKQLLESDEFNQAIEDGAELKKNIMTSYKLQHKTNFARFYETMLESREDIQKILDTRKKNRTDDDKNKLKQFKQDVAKTYNQVRDFLMPEKVEEGKLTKIEKLVDKIASAVDMLSYIGSDVLAKEFKKRGLSIVSTNEYPEKFDNDATRDNVKDIFECAVSIKKKVVDDNDFINDNIYTTKVPVELQYDKKTNNTGLKTGDFRKLVDLKTKLVMAKTQEDKDKIDEKLEDAAAEKQFEMARAELVRDKLTNLQ